MHTFWKPVSGAWYELPAYHGSSTGVTPVSGECYYIPQVMPRVTIDQLYVETTVASVDSSSTDVIRVGLYNPSATTGLPSGSPVIDFGTFNLETAVPGVALDVTNTTVAGLYWWAVVRQVTGTPSTAGQVRSSNFTSPYSGLLYQTTSLPVTNGAGSRFYTFKETGVSGALGTPGTLTLSADSVPIIWYKSA